MSLIWVKTRPRARKGGGESCSDDYGGWTFGNASSLRFWLFCFESVAELLLCRWCDSSREFVSWFTPLLLLRLKLCFAPAFLGGAHYLIHNTPRAIIYIWISPKLSAHHLHRLSANCVSARIYYKFHARGPPLKEFGEREHLVMRPARSIRTAETLWASSWGKRSSREGERDGAEFKKAYPEPIFLITNFSLLLNLCRNSLKLFCKLQKVWTLYMLLRFLCT